MKVSKIALAAALLLLPASLAFAQENALKDLTVEQAPAAQIVAPRPGNVATSVVADRADATYAIGETVRLTLTANQDAYVTVLDVGPSGETTQLFPNRFQPDNHLMANRPVEIAGPGTGARIVASGPAGVELIKVITANKPVAVVPEAHLQGAGPFRTIAGGAATVVRDLQVAADSPPSADTLIAFANFGLYTIPGRAAANGAVVIVTGQQAAATPSRVVIPAEQPFPLLIAADKASYRVGDKPTIAVSTTQACNLTVLEFTASGVARTIFPNGANPSGALAARQSVFVAGIPGSDLTLTGPAGVEQVLATCTSPDAAAAAGQAPAGGAPLPAAAGASTDVVVVAKNLSVVASRPGTAMASVIFTVQP